MIDSIFIILVTILCTGLGIILLKKPHFMTEITFFGLSFNKRLIQFVGFWFTILGSIMVVASIFSFIKLLVSKEP